MEPRIRLARTGDAGDLHMLAAATFPLACPPATTDEDIAAFVAEHLSTRRFSEYLADPERAVLVAEDEGSLVGWTMLVVGEPTDADAARAVTVRPTAELSKCYVAVSAQGSGVATALVEATMTHAVGIGMSAVWLGVNQQNARANGFYDKSGFGIVGVKRFRVGTRVFDDYVRERVLGENGPAAAGALAL